MNKLMIAALSGMAALGAFAESKPFQASLTPDIAVEDKGTRIEGVALSIWGENEQKAFALGFVNGSTGDSAGVSLGLLNYSESYTGAQLAFVNYSTGAYTGLQLGTVNYATKLKGLQLGFVNYAETAESGVQIGFINLLPETTEWFSGFPDEVAPGMIFVNWRLN